MFLVLLMATALAAPQPAPAGPSAPASAHLNQPREARLILDGRSWICDRQGACTGRGAGAPQPLMRECRRFVARMGAVAAFARGDVALGPAELDRCNAG